MGEADDERVGEVDQADEAEDAEDAEDPEGTSHPCPEHPDTQVLGTCTRCGAYFCAECLSAADRPEDSSRCANCDPVVEPRMFGGWLWLPAIGLVVTTAQLVLRCTEDIRGLTSPEIPELVPWLAFELLTSIAFLALTGFAASHFVRKKRRAINLMVAFYATGFGIAILDIVGRSWAESVVGPLEPTDGPTMVRGLIAPLIWIAYFTNSKRVRETFVVE